MPGREPHEILSLGTVTAALAAGQDRHIGAILPLNLDCGLTAQLPLGTFPGVQRSRKQRAFDQKAIDRGLERFRATLRERALKMSKVRESIARAALTYAGHFSVEELVQSLNESGVKDAHLATVYRAMPLLVEAGLVQAVLISKSEGQRYEASFEREHHDHLVCTSCGRVVEYQSEALQALEREIARRFDFELDDHLLELRGRCKSCRRGDH